MVCESYERSDNESISLKKNSSLWHLYELPYKRSLDGNAPYDKAMKVYPNPFFEVLDLQRIPDEDVILKPGIIRKRIRARTVKDDPGVVKDSK